MESEKGGGQRLLTSSPTRNKEKGREKGCDKGSYKVRDNVGDKMGDKVSDKVEGILVQSLCYSDIRPVIERGPINFWRLCLPSEPGRGASAGNHCLRILAFTVWV